MLITSEKNRQAPTISLKNLNAVTVGSSTKNTYSPINATTGKAYNGINRIILADAVIASGYQSNVWATYCQAKNIGLNVAPGQKPVKIIYWKEDESGHFNPEYANLYNMEQMDITDGTHNDAANLSTISECSDVLKLISRADVVVNHTSLASCYQRTTDTVLIANSEQFNTVDEYYADWIKQLIHSTKHAKRLGRNYVKYTNSLQEAVACEELVVFVGFRFFCDAMGCKMPSDIGSNIYKNCWEDIVSNHPSLLIKVCSDAQKAIEYMLDHWVLEKPVLQPDNYSTPIGLTCAL